MGEGKKARRGGGSGGAKVFQLLLPKPLAAAPLAVAASPLLLVRAKPNNTASYAGYIKASVRNITARVS